MKILIAEDDFTSRFVLRSILAAMDDLEIYEAEDGLKAWEMLQDGLLPELCFLDFNMPRMNGLDLLKRIRNNPRLAAVKVCFCSAVRDRQVIVQAVSLQTDNYILKPYDRAAIHAQVHKVRGIPRPAEILENPADVCARLGIDQAAYDSRLNAVLQEVRALTTRLPTLFMQLDVAGALSVLEKIKQSAQDLGIRRIYNLVDRLSRSIRSDGNLTAEFNKEAAARLQDWLSRSADHLMQMMSDMPSELLTIARLVAETRGVSPATSDTSDCFKGRQQAELDGLICTLSEVFRRGKLLATTKNIRSKSLNVPVKASFLGEDAAQTVGALTRRISFSLTLLDAETAEAIENCRKINDLARLLSFPLEAGVRWIPDAAIHLLEQEVDARNDQGIMLLRQAIGPDFEAFVRQQEVIVREHLTRVYQQTENSDRVSEVQVQAIIRDVRERLQPALDGKLTAHPVFSDLDLGNLAERGDDDRWSSPFSLLQNAALLFRTAITDPGFDRAFKFSTFDRQIFLKTMDVFGDVFGQNSNPERAAREIRQLEALATSPVSWLEKCRLAWAIIKGETKSSSSPPQVQMETPHSIPSVDQAASKP